MASDATATKGNGHDVPNAVALAALDPEAFAAQVPAVLSSVRDKIFGEVRSGERPHPESLVIRDRASEPLTVVAIASTIRPPLMDKQAGLLAWTTFYEVLAKLPYEDLHPHRPALELLSTAKSDDEYYGAEALRHSAKELIRFIDEPEAVWVPAHKGDYIGERSINDRVKTAEEMKPHMLGLAEWLGDGNWPPFHGCWKQLARFPEAAVGTIRTVIERERGDGGWVLNLLEFVDEVVPIGPAWEEVRPVVQALVDEPKGDEDEWELKQRGEAWLKKLNEWKESQAKEA
ncbi:hypothetical protein B0T10DRAFT_501285 [Thelonectria olida]|uniref:DUF5071 domain-containing protein n=1 Tax=Thelonectria olida TaxID=1576542 RepID=A0A9P9AIE5_9HYPO|nr:hypothetical protein B0T10DRAFT_501285 [Thelonectria olida]